MTTTAFEELRQSYRPAKVRLLLVGESPPAGGTFFYRGDSNLARYTCEAFSRAHGLTVPVKEFPATFRDLGRYLVDLCLEPIDGKEDRERTIARRAGIPQLARTLEELQPERIVVVMKAIEDEVRAAVAKADLQNKPPLDVLPFPATGNQRRYVNELIPLLTTISLLPTDPRSDSAGAPPTITLTPMTDDDYAAFFAHATVEYAKDQVTAGNWTPDEALDKARKEFTDLLTDGVRTANNWLFTVVNAAGEQVGILHYATHPRRADVAYVYDLEIYEPFRRRGYASAALAALEQDARARGFQRMQLHVFGSNAAARALYQKLGYEETSVIMTKAI